MALDSRFSAVLNDERFRVPESKYDKYGRKQSGGKKGAADDLSAFYTLEDESGSGDEGGGGDFDKYDNYEDLVAAEAELEAAKDASSTGKKKLKPKPTVLKRQKFKPGEKLPTDEVERRLAFLNRMARGELESGEESDSDSTSESSSDEGSGDESGEGNEGSSAQGKLGKGSVWSGNEGGPVQAVVADDGAEETARLAVCNLDWDHLGAVDLLALFESFVPAGGAVRRITVYPSDYGLERMAEEDRLGPRLWSSAAPAAGGAMGREGEGSEDGGSEDEDDEEEEEDGDEDGDAGSDASERLGSLDGGDGGKRTKVGLVFAGSDDELSEEEGLPAPLIGVRAKNSRTQVAAGYGKTKDFDEEELRRYEMQRAKYYFAVVDCDSGATAGQLYGRVDGLEWEYSSSRVDLSFVPDDVDFGSREARDSASSVPANYAAPAFVTSARQQTRVACTWDEDDPSRSRALGRLADWRNVGLAAEDVSGLIALESSSGSESGSESDGSDDGGGDGSGGSEGGGGVGKKAKAAELRKLMGLGGSDDDSGGSDSESGGSAFGDDDFFADDGEEGDAGGGYTFVDPGKEADLRDKIEARLAAKKGGPGREETPWEATQRKLAEKKKTRKAARKARLEAGHRGDEAESSSEDETRNATDAEFFVDADADDDGAGAGRAGSKKAKAKGGEAKANTQGGGQGDGADDSENEEEDEDEARNYDMRAVVRAAKMSGKKLKVTPLSTPLRLRFVCLSLGSHRRCMPLDWCLHLPAAGARTTVPTAMSLTMSCVRPGCAREEGGPARRRSWTLSHTVRQLQARHDLQRCDGQ